MGNILDILIIEDDHTSRCSHTGDSERKRPSKTTSYHNVFDAIGAVVGAGRPSTSKKSKDGDAGRVLR